MGGRGREEGKEEGKASKLVNTMKNAQCACLSQSLGPSPILPHLVYFKVGYSDQVLLIMGPGYVGEDVFKRVRNDSPLLGFTADTC